MIKTYTKYLKFKYPHNHIPYVAIVTVLLQLKKKNPALFWASLILLLIAAIKF